MKRELLGVSISLLTALMAAYSATWGVHYLNVIQKSQSHIIDLIPYQRNCQEVGIHDAQCIHAYSIPISSTKTLDTLTLGVVTPSYIVSCDHDGRIKETKASVVENRNTIAKVDIKSANCQHYIDVSIFGADYYKLVGVVTGIAFFSDKKYAAAFSDFCDFFFSEFRIILLVLFLFSLAISLISHHVNLPSLSSSFPDYYLLPWALFLLVSSGVFSRLTGGVIEQSSYVHLNSLLSSIANLGPAIYVLLARTWKNEKALLGSVIMTLFAPILLPNWLVLYPYLGIISALAAVPLTLIKKDLLSSFYFLALFVNYLKLAGGIGIRPVILPHIHFSAIFLGCLYLCNSFRRIILIVGIFKLNHTRSTKIDETDADSFMHGALDRIKGSTSFTEQELYIYSPGSDRVQLFENNNSGKVTKSILADCIPFDILASLSILQHSEDEKLDTKNRCLSIAMHELNEISVVYRSKIGTDWFNTDLHNDIRLSSSFIKDFLTRALSNYRVLKQLETEQVKKNIMELFQQVNSTEVFRNGVLSYLNSLNLRLFIGEVDQVLNKVEILEVFGYNQETEYFLRRLHFNTKSNKDVTTPIPMAIEKKKSLAIEDITLLKSHFSAYTKEFLTTANSSSLLIIPKFLNLPDVDLQRIFILCFDSTTKATFNSSLTTQLEYFAEVATTKFVHVTMLNHSKMALTTLAQSVPQRVLNKIQLGQAPREEARGILVCLDLIGSTILYKAIGEQSWALLVQTVSDELNKILAAFPTMSHELVVWDAFFVRIIEPIEAPLVNKTLREIFTATQSILAQYSHRTHKLGIRICLTYGDITTDFSSGVNPKWTITGTAMSRLCKFENSIKSLGEGIYIDPNSERDLGYITIETPTEPKEVDRKKAA